MLQTVGVSKDSSKAYSSMFDAWRLAYFLYMTLSEPGQVQFFMLRLFSLLPNSKNINV
jgi:hypothetical protein